MTATQALVADLIRGQTHVQASDFEPFRFTDRLRYKLAVRLEPVLRAVHLQGTRPHSAAVEQVSPLGRMRLSRRNSCMQLAEQRALERWIVVTVHGDL